MAVGHQTRGITPRTPKRSPRALARGGRLGKYRLVRRVAEGGYGEVWRAHDTVEDVAVAVKLPLPERDGRLLAAPMLREIRTIVRLRHPNIIPVRNADIIDGRLALVTDLASGALDDVPKPLPVRRSFAIAAQVLAGLAHAHGHKIIHRDVTPGNIFLFPNGRVLLGDFGIAKEVLGATDTTQNTGTQGYAAPEQMFGRPTYASDCFSVGLVLYECLTGALPKWPFAWPFPRAIRLARRVSPVVVGFLRRALAVDERERFASAGEMLEALDRAAPEHMPRHYEGANGHCHHGSDWRRVRREAFLARYGRVLELDYSCANCDEPVAEVMANCPWCGYRGNSFATNASYSRVCGDCNRGILPEWRFCPWCYGPGFTDPEPNPRPHWAYRAECRRCSGKLMRFMRYCPWCRSKVRRKWHVRPFPETCARCRWSVDSDFWTYCSWCHLKLND